MRSSCPIFACFREHVVTGAAAIIAFPCILSWEGGERVVSGGLVPTDADSPNIKSRPDVLLVLLEHFREAYIHDDPAKRSCQTFFVKNSSFDVLVLVSDPGSWDQLGL